MTKILVSDFDGTMTQVDFYRLAIERLIPPATPDYWSEYRSGARSHFEALNEYFQAIRASDEEMVSVLADMQLDPSLHDAVVKLEQDDWRVVITSAGCLWYINRLLTPTGLDLEIHANPGDYSASTGLTMRLPTESPFHCPDVGIDKAAIVRSYQQQSEVVAFAGDGFPDAEAAKLVPADVRFARGDLAEVLREENIPFHEFATWSEITPMLTN